MRKPQPTLKHVQMAHWPFAYRAAVYLDGVRVGELTSPEPGTLEACWKNATAEVIVTRLAGGDLLTWVDKQILARRKRTNARRYRAHQHTGLL